jgi:hypothetical protein
MWQVYLYLANEHQVRDREARARGRRRRWPFGRRDRDGVAQPIGEDRGVSRAPERLH